MTKQSLGPMVPCPAIAHAVSSMPLPPLPRSTIPLTISLDQMPLSHQRRMSQSSTRSFRSDFDVVSEKPSPPTTAFALPARHPFSLDSSTRVRYTPLPSPLSPGLSPHPVDGLNSLLLRPCREPEVTSIDIPATLEFPIACARPTPSFSTESRGNHHSQFYFTEDLVIFDVEGCLFRVHRSLLDEGSAYFRDVFARNLSKGGTDDSPILLWRVTRSSFETLLRYLYFGAHDDSSYTQSDWIHLLIVATNLSFPTIRAHTIHKLELIPLDAIERIQLATKYSVPQWLMTAYVQLCSRDSPLHESEAHRLGAQVTAKICEVRERILRETIFRMHQELVDGVAPNTECTFPAGLRDSSHVAQTIRDVFQLD